MHNKETIEKAQEVVRICFEANAKVDTIVNRLDVVFNMPKASEIVHHKIAHVYPVAFGDKITEFLSKRGIKVNYGNIPLQNKDYSNILECFTDIVITQREIENAVIDTIKTAEVNGDIDIKIFFENFLVETVVLHTKQAYILQNKAGEYIASDIVALFDAHIDTFIIVPSL